MFQVKLQEVMIDQISDNMDKATDHLNEVSCVCVCVCVCV